jgi:hypothetical protein
VRGTGLDHQLSSQSRHGGIALRAEGKTSLSHFDLEGTKKMATDYDMDQVVKSIRSLPGDEGRETSLCLLIMLLPFQLRLSALAEQKQPTQAEVEKLHQELFDLMVQLRDRLLAE